MFSWEVSEIAKIVSGSISGPESYSINSVLIDSRSSAIHPKTIFIALKGPNHNGHDYIEDLIIKGVKAFIIDEDISEIPENISTIRVNSCLTALQQMAAHHRKSFTGHVIAITGSNGKTIVKEWLGSVLAGSFKISKSPKSYNSQVGVALSILQANPLSDIHIIEAGISKPGEMKKLELMISPDSGLITNIGEAHQENFDTIEQKLVEKLHLFKGCRKLFYCSNHLLIKTLVQQFAKTTCELKPWLKESFTVKSKFSDQASIENLSHVFNISKDLGISIDLINKRIDTLEPLAMRMEQKRGINGCTLINDYYNSDFQSIQNAIDLLWQQTPQVAKTLIISDILQSGESDNKIISRIKEILKGKDFHRIIGIGDTIHRYDQEEKFFTKTYPDTKSFLDSIDHLNFNDEAILLKGARAFQFEKISSRLEAKMHRTVLKINMPTLRNNLNHYRNSLEPGVKIMCMVKALSYGSGTHEIARFLAHQNIDYLAVAFIDEGIKLRMAGVVTPIMVMNPDYSQIDALIKYNLEPEIFNFSGLKRLIKHLNIKDIYGYPVHIKLDTGMHRLGINIAEIEPILSELNNKRIRIASLFSHLAAAGDPEQDSFSTKQIETFNKACEIICEKLDYKPLKHILNTAGITRFPGARYDMVRLGIGLYGFGSNSLSGLESPLTFQSYISQVHNIKKDETIGYDRLGSMPHDGKIGIIPVGYADGFDRRLGNGNWSVQVGDEQNIRTIGQVCMDMCMIDLTQTNAKEGDIVTILKGKSGITSMADTLGTIPYEILTSFSSRITRVYEFD